MIMDKLIYFDEYENIDKNMSDSNAGARKNKNCRNHSFIVNGVLHEQKQENLHPIDILIYDVAKCFDEEWPADSLNVLYDLGVRNDNLCLLYEGTKKTKIAINTAVGQTERFQVENLIAQGSSWGPLMTSASVDTIGKSAQETGENCFIYKDTVKIPPLSFVDDVASMSLCGVDSIVTNATINTKIQAKKLRCGPTKCHQLHIGTKNKFCPSLKVNENDEMEKVSEDKYLGEIISDSKTNSKKVASAKNKGMAAISVIMAILNDVSLGSHYFEMAMMLRESLFINSILWNIETWYDLKKSEIEEIEMVDRILLKRILGVPSSTQSALLYLELAVTPLSYIIKARRIMFNQEKR